MSDQTATYNPHAELKVLTERENYHVKERRRQQTIAMALSALADHTWTADERQYVAAQAQSAADMALYHAQEAERTRTQRQDAQDRCNDLDGKRAVALHAAADAADMAGDAGLAIELNRRAARAEGYDPDQAAAAGEPTDNDSAWDGPTHHDHR